MTTTDANGIAFVETTDAVSPLQVLLNALQQSTSNAITGLKAKDFVAQATAPAHSAGLRWFNTTTGVTSISDGTRWVGAGGDLVESSITSTVGPVGAGIALALVGTCFIDLTAGRWEITAGASIRTP